LLRSKTIAYPGMKNWSGIGTSKRRWLNGLSLRLTFWRWPPLPPPLPRSGWYPLAPPRLGGIFGFRVSREKGDTPCRALPISTLLFWFSFARLPRLCWWAMSASSTAVMESVPASWGGGGTGARLCVRTRTHYRACSGLVNRATLNRSFLRLRDMV
jgi:hypothetical protein